jgi:hypothetical protein
MKKRCAYLKPLMPFLFNTFICRNRARFASIFADGTPLGVFCSKQHRMDLVVLQTINI